MRRFATTFVITFLTITLYAQNMPTMREMFANMPEDLLPYLTKNNRLDLIDFVESGMKARVLNTFDDTVALHSLTDNYAFLQLSPVSWMEMKVLPGCPNKHFDATLCVIETFGESFKASKITFYTPEWEKLNVDDPMQCQAEDFLEESEKDTKQRLYPLLIVAKLDSCTYDLTLNVTPFIDLSSEDSKEDDSVLLKQKSLKWDGVSFK